MRTYRHPALFALTSLISVGVLSIQAATLTMDELPTQPVNGLTFNGVTFSFTISGLPSLDANYNAADGGIEVYVQDPSLEGNSLGVLTLDFATPTSGIQFGAVRSVAGPMTPGLQVGLFGPGLAPLGSFNLNTSVLASFSEGLFTSPLTVSRAVLSFPNANTATRFAIDNLVYTVPEPNTFCLIGGGVLGLALLRRKSNR